MESVDLKLDMQGIELSRQYYEEIGKPVFREMFPKYIDQMVAGLVGEGSECYGFDDEISKDHDYGPSFCIWLPETVYAEAGKWMQELYEFLPDEYKGVKMRISTQEAAGRRGVMEINSFYCRFLGRASVPETLMDWMRIPETYLAVATNGQVFEDPLGKFSEIRNKLLAFYPEDVRKKKIAGCVMNMAQAGQYNYGRMMLRNEKVAAMLALDEFIRNTVAAIYLLNRKYMPYYKWMWRGMDHLEILKDSRELLLEAAEYAISDKQKVLQLVEEISTGVIQELKRQELSESKSDYLGEHAYEIMGRIEDDQIRSLSVLAK